MIFHNFDKVIFNYRYLLGSGIGLANPFVVAGSNNTSNINLFIHQLSIPRYHKVMYDVNTMPSYHISGYGQSCEESLTRAMGETIERYSFMAAHNLLKDRIVHDSYENLLKHAHVLPLEFLNTYSEKDPQFTYADPAEKIDWIQLKNYAGTDLIYYPYAMLSGWYNTKRLLIPSVSTGTATHLSYEQAIANALTESFQIHNFMLAWYGKITLPVLDWKPYVSAAFHTILKKTYNDYKDFKITVLDNSSTDFYFPSYITIISNTQDNFPFCAVGIQGGLNNEYALLRSLMEATAIYVNLQSLYLYQYEQVNSLTYASLTKSYNLDDPFLYWANYNDRAVKQDILNNLISNTKKKKFVPSSTFNKEEEFKALIQTAVKQLHYFSVIDITSPELLAFNYKTVKVLTPELIPMILPALPYTKHPAFKKFGGIRNANFPHPLP